MKKRRYPPTPACCAAIALALLMAIPTTRSHAAQLIKTDAYHLAADQSISNSAWMVAGSIVLEGEVGNDIFIFAQEPIRWKNEIPAGSIVLKGTALNDVWAIGKKIAIEGKIMDHARLAAPQGAIIIGGSIENEAILWAETIYLQTNAALKNGGILFAQEVIAQGAYSGPVTIRANSVTLAGTFDSDVNVTAREISLLAGADIAGTLTYVSTNELTLSDGVKVSGGLVRKEEDSTASPMDSTILQIWLFIGSLLTCGLFWKIFPDTFENAASLAADSLLKCMLAGLLVSSLLITIIMLSALSIVGLPLAITLMAAGGLLAYLAKSAAALAFGGKILRMTMNREKPGFVGLTIGLAMLYVFTGFPGMLGALIWIGITLLGMGSLMLSILAQTKWARPFGLSSTNTFLQPQPLPKGE